MKSCVHFLPEGLTVDRPVLAGRWSLLKPHPLLHYHDSLEILYAERSFILNVGRDYLLQAGTIFILPPGVQHIARPKEGDLPKGIFGSHLAIDETQLTPSQNDSGWTCGPIDPAHRGIVWPLYEYLQNRMINQRAEWSSALRDVAIGLLGILRDLGYCRKTKGRSALSPVSEAISIMRARYMDHNLSVSELASAVNVSTSYFRKIFRLETKCSPQKFLTQLRLDRAMYHLQTQQYKASAVAKMVGFSSPSSLHRHMRSNQRKAQDRT